MKSASSFVYYARPSAAPSAGPVRGPQPVADTNVFEVKLYQLDQESAIAEGTPVFCENCKAVRNLYSQTVEEEGQKRWGCEFCSCPNILPGETPNAPSDEVCTYLLDPTIRTPTAPTTSSSLDDDSTTIFCIDTSGSMQTNFPLQQPIMHHGRQLTTTNRIESVKMTVEAQIHQMLAETPSKKVGIVEFQTFVTMHGDGRYREVVPINQDYWQNYQPLLGYVEGKHDHYVGRPLSQSKNDLLDRLNSLTAPGAQELLGPGVLLALGLAMQGKPGSKVVLCTDGITYTEPGFYDAVGLMAQQHGVSISVISFTSGDCNLAGISALADLTEGSVWRVGSEYLVSRFGAGADASRPDAFNAILSERVVATEVQATVTLHKALKFKNERAQEVQQGGSQLRRKVGNASQFSSFTFEYAVKTEEELVISEVDMEGVTQLPFQLALQYRNLKGQLCLKTYSKVLRVTSNQEEAERAVDFDVLSRNYQVQNARKAAGGQYSALKETDGAYQTLLARHAASEEQKQELEAVNEQMDVLNTAVARQTAMGPARMQDDLSLAINQFKKAKKRT